MLKKAEASKLKRVMDNCYMDNCYMSATTAKSTQVQAQTPSPYQSSAAPPEGRSRTTGTPSPMSPQPSPAGSVNSVGSVMATSMTPEERGWQVGKSLPDCLSHMLEEQVGCDVTFQIKSPGGTITKMSAHKFMLTARSPVFEAMFGGNFVETTQDPVITDIEPMPFKDILGYIYTDTVKLTGDNVLQILFGAKKYMITSLEKRCTQFLVDEISEENVASVLTHSLTFEDNDLVDRCLEFTSPKIKTVCKTEAFHNMSYDALLKVLKCDKLAEGFEADLFEQSMEWAKKHMKEDSAADDKEMRTVLGECLHEIRFMSLTTETFAKRVAHFDVLTGDEKSAFLCHWLTGDEKHSSTLKKHGFQMTSRITQFQRFSNKYGTSFGTNSSGRHEIFKMSSNTAILLLGFSVYAPSKGTFADVSITIADDPNNTDVGKLTKKITSDATGQAIPVFFDNEIALKSGVWYKTCVTVNGVTGYGEGLLSSNTSGLVTISYQGHSYPLRDSRGNSISNRGQVQNIIAKAVW